MEERYAEMHRRLAELIYRGSVMRDLTPTGGLYSDLHGWARAGYEAVANDVLVEIGWVLPDDDDDEIDPTPSAYPGDPE